MIIPSPKKAVHIDIKMINKQSASILMLFISFVPNPNQNRPVRTTFYVYNKGPRNSLGIKPLYDKTISNNRPIFGKRGSTFLFI